LAVSNEARSPSLPSLLGNYSNSEVASLVNQIQNLEIIQIDDVASNNNLNPTQRELLTSFGVTSQLLLPIKTRTNQMGAIVCSHCSGTRSWSKSEVELLKAVVDQLAIAIDQSQLYTSAHATAAAATAQAEELQQTLQKLQQTQVQLIQTAKMSSLGQMIAGIAHELNNPVTFIYGNVDPASEYAQSLLHLLQLYQQHYPQPPASIQAQREAMDFDFLVEDFPRLLTSLKMGAIRIHDLVVSLRNFSRLDEAEKKVVDIHEGIDNTLLILGNRLKSKSGHPTLEIVKKYGQLPKVECYAGQLNQVFMNLLNNAIDAVENQPPPRRITIVTEVLADTNLVRIGICDNGKGITEEAKTHLFDPFFTTKPVGQGTGLGLSISYQIVVEKHGGILKCFSELGQGTEFWVEIPIVQSKTLPKVSPSRSSSRSFNVAYDMSRLCS
jgi:signal transduction histidine kinase